jgi:hypothetical protein
MYNHQNIDWWLTAPATPATFIGVVDPLAAIVPLRMGYQPVMAVAIYALVTTAPTVTATILAFKYRPTLGSATGEIVIGTLTVPVATPINTLVYKVVDNTKCPSAGEIIASTTQGSTAGAGHVGVMLAPNWDAPGNNLKMLRSV